MSDRTLSETLALELMRKGRPLQKMHTHNGMRWFVVPGGQVTDAVACRILARRDHDRTGESIVKIAIKDLLPNPFRHMERYPINQAKVDQLKASIKATEFWDNLVVRKAPDNHGKFELAYGHHRLRALQELHHGEVDLPVRDLDNNTMAIMMAQENMEEWGSNALIEQETIRSIVQGYADGRIDLRTPSAKKKGGRIRYAPRFSVVSVDPFRGTDRPYTVETIQKFLRWPFGRMQAALDALSAIEEALIPQESFDGLSVYQAEVVAREARRVLKETDDKQLARSVGQQLAKGMEKITETGNAGKHERAEITKDNACRKANEMVAKSRRINLKPKKLPPLGKFAERLTAEFGKLLSDKMKEELEAVIEYRNEKDLSAAQQRKLAEAMRAHAEGVTKYADRVEDGAAQKEQHANTKRIAKSADQLEA